MTAASTDPDLMPSRVAALLVDPHVVATAKALPRLKSQWEDLEIAVEIWLCLAEDSDLADFNPQSGDEVWAVLERRPESAANVSRVIADLTRAAAC